MILMTQCILLALVTCTGVSGYLIDAGPKECAQGIDYWCQDLGTARACGAIKHCINNVWSFRVPPADNSTICDVCKTMVQEARDQLESNETQEEIKEVFEGTCRIYFPLKVISDQCIQLVDDYLPDLIEELYSMMNPQTVCATAWLCNSNQFLRLLGVSKFEKVSTVCDECVDTATAFITKIKSMTDAQFEAQLENVCNALPSEKSECKIAVEMYGKTLHSAINNMDPKEACQLAGLCDGLHSKPIYQLTLLDGTLVSTSLRKLGETPECGFCKTIIAYIKQQVTTATTREEVKDVLVEICEKLGTAEDVCKDYVYEYFDEIYDYIVNELDPELVCAEFGVCMMSDTSVAFTDIKPAQHIESNDIDWTPVVHPAVVKVPSTHLATVKKPGNGNVSCALCEYGLHELQILLGDEKTQEAIRDALDRLCSQLPATLTSECQEYVDGYSEIIMSMISQGIAPEAMCAEMGLCPAVHKFSSLKLKLPQTRPQIHDVSSSRGFTACEICNLIISTIDSMLEDPATEQEIVHAVDNVCNLVPKAVYNECISLIDTYGQYVISLIPTLATSKQVCQAIELCPQSKSQSQSLLGSDKCTRGPSYWCQSIYHARACKMEQHCRDKIWK